MFVTVNDTSPVVIPSSDLNHSRVLFTYSQSSGHSFVDVR